MRRAAVALAFLSLAGASVAQVYRPGWTSVMNDKTEGGEYGASIALDPMGNVFALGSTAPRESGALRRDLVLRKFSPLGQVLWDVRLDPTNKKIDDWAHSVVSAPNGDLFVSSAAPLPNQDRFVMSRVSGANGQIMWSQILDTGQDRATPRHLIVDPTGGVIQAGGVGSNARGGLLAVKWSESGTPVWTTRFAGPQGDSECLGAAVSSTGEVALTGYITTATSGQDLVVGLISPGGTLSWQKSYSGSAGFGRDKGTAVTFSPNGEVWVAGELYVEGSVSYLTLLRLNKSDGRELGRTIISTPRGIAGAAAGIHPTAGGVLVGGQLYEITANGTDLAVVKFSSTGEKMWHTLVNAGEKTEELGRAFALDSYGNAYIAGESAVRNLTGLTLLGRVNRDGKLAWQHKNDQTDFRSHPGQILVDSITGNVYVIGSPDGGVTSRFSLQAFFQSPTASGDSYTTPSDKPLAVEAGSGVKSNDIFGKLATVELVTPPKEGTLVLTPEGGLTYSPAKDFVGKSTFRYRLNREGLAPSEADVVITVTKPVPPPK